MELWEHDAFLGYMAETTHNEYVTAFARKMSNEAIYSEDWRDRVYENHNLTYEEKEAVIKAVEELYA